MYLLTQIQLVNLDAQDQTIPADTNIGRRAWKKKEFITKELLHLFLGTINYPGK